MQTREITFHRADTPSQLPYIHDESDTEYICDGKEGSITFDGYYYVEDTAPPYPDDEMYQPRCSQWLPQKVIMHVHVRETEPCEEEPLENGVRTFYKTLEQHFYNIEIYKRVIHECTDRISKVDDSDGEEMNICFFPTNKQTIYFRILETIA